MPNSFGSCLTVTKIASPKTNPSITGLERNWAMNPSPTNPATRKRPPQNRIMVAASTVYAVEPWGWSAITVEASRTAEAEVPAATTWRLVPKIA